MNHQHYIPKAYLKNFATEIDSNFFVEVKMKGQANVHYKPLSINDICVQKNIYTLPGVGDKFYLEKFYAHNVDSLYPKVYKKLINPEVNEITPFERSEIIKVLTSLHFRNPRFMNVENKAIDRIHKYLVSKKGQDGRINGNYFGIYFDFNESELEGIIRDLKENNRIKFIKQHFSEWRNYALQNWNAGIVVYKIDGDTKLISSDCPIMFKRIEESKMKLLNITNIIQIPLDPQHYVCIYPSDSNEVSKLLFRGTRDNSFAIGLNDAIQENCDLWIYGKLGAVKGHLFDNNKFNQITPENLVVINNLKLKTERMEELYLLIEELGFENPVILNKVNSLLKEKEFKDDKLLLEMKLHLSGKTYN